MDQTTSYRDSISTVDKSGKRVWIHPKRPSGKWHRRRVIVSYSLLALLFAGPHLTISGHPVLLFNILERKFVILGQVFWPQDFHLFAIGMITFVVCVTLFTVIYGRLFCGWVCPQTVFLEMVFRKIEYLLEGDWTYQKRLKKSPWTRAKILKKGAKHIIFWGISFLIANTFLAYIIGSSALWEIQIDDPLHHIGGLFSILIFTTIFYLVFAKLKEQVCTTICPYGRLQGVLMDSKSLVVAYDNTRGEPRGKVIKNEYRPEQDKGDCVDCEQCVNVCPTGIDIRNGTQLECVNCTACIDACDFIMNRLKMETGLIRYASEENIKNGAKFKWTSRVKSYTILFVVLVGLLGYLIGTRSDYEATIFRQRGTTVRKFSETQYSNTYEYSLINKTNSGKVFRIELIEGGGEIKMLSNDTILPKHGTVNGRFLILIDKTEVEPRSNPITIGLISDGEIIESIDLSFMGPLL